MYIFQKKRINMQCKLIGFKNDKLPYKCEVCRKGCVKLINKAVKNFPILYQFCKGDLNNFFLLLRKGVYPMNIWIAWKNLTKL